MLMSSAVGSTCIYFVSGGVKDQQRPPINQHHDYQGQAPLQRTHPHSYTYLVHQVMVEELGQHVQHQLVHLRGEHRGELPLLVLWAWVCVLCGRSVG